jgi:FKBP-type peptidyl-prolyl cis-trans isomerase
MSALATSAWQCVTVGATKDPMKPRIVSFFVVAFLFASGLANAKGPVKKEGGKTLPTYEEVVKAYADGVRLCETEADIVGGDDQQLSLEGGYISVNGYGQQQYQCYGTKLTVRKKVTLKGKTYPPETKLTVDKDLYWIEVSGWQPSAPRSASKPSPSADPQEAADDVATPTDSAGENPIAPPSDVAAPPKNAIKTASGLAYVNLTKGSGKQHPYARDRVRVHYSGWTTNGKLFDSSVVRGEPVEFPLNGVIKGWTEGVRLMVIGDKTRFWIPGELAYGNSPSRPGVPSGMLVFDIELLEIIPPE